MKKIKILTGVLGENRSGRFTYAVDLFLALDPERYEVTFLSNVMDPFMKEEILKRGGEIEVVTPRSVSVSQHRRELEMIIREGHYDVCHIHLATASNIEPLVLAKKLGVKTVIAHSHSSQLEGSSPAAKVLHRLNRLRLGAMGITLIGCSNAAGKFMYPGRFFNLYNGVDTKRFDYSPAHREEVRRQLSLENAFVMGHVGRLMPVKNHDFLLELFGEVAALEENAKLILCGDGPLKEKLQQKAHALGVSDKVLFLGDVSDPERYYSAMDVLLLPSLFEGFPLTVLEGVAAGLKVFVSDRVTKEVAVEDRVEFFSLDEEKKTLARRILNEKDAPRRSGSELLNRAGLSMKEHLRQMEKIYNGEVPYGRK